LKQQEKVLELTQGNLCWSDKIQKLCSTNCIKRLPTKKHMVHIDITWAVTKYVIWVFPWKFKIILSKYSFYFWKFSNKELWSLEKLKLFVNLQSKVFPVVTRLVNYNLLVECENFEDLDWILFFSSHAGLVNFCRTTFCLLLYTWFLDCSED